MTKPPRPLGRGGFQLVEEGFAFFDKRDWVNYTIKSNTLGG